MNYVCHVQTKCISIFHDNIRCYKEKAHNSLTENTQKMQIPGRNKACQHVHGFPGGRTYVQCSILGISDSEREDPDKGRNYFVKALIEQGEYYCQYCKFERDGIVCCHILKVMDMNAVTRMPRHFIRR